MKYVVHIEYEKYSTNVIQENEFIENKYFFTPSYHPLSWFGMEFREMVIHFFSTKKFRMKNLNKAIAVCNHDVKDMLYISMKLTGGTYWPQNVWFKYFYIAWVAHRYQNLWLRPLKALQLCNNIKQNKEIHFYRICSTK